MARLSALAAYGLWALAFIRSTSFVIEGTRFYCLFDDAMVSLRYAWNFAHGRGLVYNVGERVEGFSNLLTTVLMALPARFLDERGTVLCVQLAGVATMLLIGIVAWDTGACVGEGATGPWAGLPATLATFAFFPLSFWTLLGMETGLLTLLVGVGALRVLKDRPAFDALFALSVALLPLVRPDGAVPALVLLALRVLAHRSAGRPLRLLLPEAAGAIAAVVGVTLFRIFYYGAVVPNTYVLKVVGLPLSTRIPSGIRFVRSAASTMVPWLLLAALGWWASRAPVRWVSGSLFVSLVAYVVWTGGDPWPYARPLCSLIPLLGALGWQGALAAGRWCRAPLGRASFAIGPAAFVLAIGMAQAPYWRFALLRAPAPYVPENRTNVANALALRRLLTKDATLAVLWAGSLSYYSDRHAIDMLGKTDPRIAHLLPVTLEGLPGMIGHNKYDLHYSIGERLPDVVQVLSRGRDDLRSLDGTTYVRVGDLWMRKGSPRVHWHLLPGAGAPPPP
jgi:arabinofuranosyltransferase